MDGEGGEEDDEIVRKEKAPSNYLLIFGRENRRLLSCMLRSRTSQLLSDAA